MKYTSFWLMFIPLFIGMLVTIVKEIKLESPMVFKKAFQTFKKVPITCGVDLSSHVIDRAIYAGKSYFENNAYALIRNYEMDARCNRAFEAARNESLAPNISLLLLMKHSYITIDAMDVHGKVSIQASDEYKEILTAVDKNGNKIYLKDNITIPYHYNIFFKKHFEDIKLIPQRAPGNSVPSDILYNIIIIGRNTQIIDKVPGGSKLLATDCFGNTEIKDNNRCFVVKSEEEALKLVEDIERAMERRVTFDRDEIITGINRIQRETN